MHIVTRMMVRLAGFFFLLGMAQTVRAECISLVKGTVAFDVKSCGVINPEASFDLNNSRYKFIGDLPADEKKKFMDSYRGLLVKGRVARSQAVRSGLSPEKGALNGEDISAFIRPGDGACAQFLGQRLKATLDEACCEGGGDAPCLLSSAYVLKDVKAIGKPDTTTGNKERVQAKVHPDYAKADEAMRKNDPKLAAQLFESVRRDGKLDVTGHYNLGLMYRQLDQCEKAIPVLEWVFKKSSKNEYWANEELIVRKANFLLARCFAKTNKPESAVIILQSYLIDPKKYKAEIRQALNHKDFGWIKTSKEYDKFIKEAHEALGAAPPSATPAETDEDL